MAKFCAQCGASIPQDSHFCPACGSKVVEAPQALAQQPQAVAAGASSLPLPGPVVQAAQNASQKIAQSFNWGWVGKSMLIMFLVLFMTGFVVFLALNALGMLTDSTVFFGSVLVLWITFFVGGGFAAYKSPGITVKEPAVAAAIMVVLLNLLAANPIGVLVGWILPFGLAYLGAKLGERAQAKAAAKAGQ